MAKSTKVSESTLKKYRSELIWKELPTKDLPMSQGLALKEVIKEYKIPAKRVGYSGGSPIIGVETIKQIIFWKDTGVQLEFKGMLNK